MFRRRTPVIQFLCADEDKGVIAEPFPAKAHLPSWLRKLAPVRKDVLGAGSNGLTVKRCMPFLDAMATGWILPLAATVRVEVSEDGRKVEYGWEFDKVMASNHLAWQVDGHPLQPRPPIKLHNYWTIRTPPGWSCLFTAPLNRAHPSLEIIAGVVDTDRYHGLINFPCVVTGSDGLHIFEKGMPLVQVIPFERRGTLIEAVIRSESEAERRDRQRVLRATEASDGWYRTQARATR